MPLSAGDKLGPYEILEPIGKGGMGEVFKAHDPRTGRAVAVKLAAERFSERFDREIRAIASLNHPNICTLYDVGPNYLVMELVDGETLADRIRRGPISLESALPIARQIADALEAAHEKGIVHRDLKPGNVKIKPDGTVKVLDFGLAKVGTHTASGGNPEESPTLTMAATQAGVILGTASYMSPEQARGKNVDKRADIWAFGVVFYEMLNGRRLFQGEDLTETLASVVKEQPDLSGAPAQVRRLLTRCLEKDPKKRLGDISVVWELLEREPAGFAPGSSRPPFGWLGWAAAVLLVSTAAFAYLWLHAPAPEASSVQFEINPPPGMQFTNPFTATDVSPDGRSIVFSAGDQGADSLWLRPLDSVTARRLQGTEKATAPFWSPDSKSIGFFQDGKLKRSDVEGGAPLVLCDAPVTGGTWNRDGTILFGSDRGISRIPASGGVPQLVTKLDPERKEIAAGFPHLLPDGKSFLYLIYSQDPGATGVYAGSLDDSKKRAFIMATPTHKASYEPPRHGQPGYLLWLREQTLMAQPFDTDKLRLLGDPVPIAESVADPLDAPFGAFWTSDAGVLTYRTSAAGEGSNLTWFDRQGKAAGMVGKPAGYGELAISPDGSQIAAFRRDAIGEDLWLIDVARGSSTRLTTDPANDSFPVWSPDGKEIAFSRIKTSGGSIYRKPAGASGAEELLLKDDGRNAPLDWSRDGRFLLYVRAQSPTSDELWVMPMREREPKPSKYLATGFLLRHGSFSPDARWVMYTSNVSGREEVYVSPFPNAASAPAVLVSTEGGAYPRWRRDGKALYYLGPQSKLMEVDVLPGSAFKVGIPKPLFEVHPRPTTDTAGWMWDISADGQRFLFNILTDQQSIAPLTVMTDWRAKLKR